MRLLIHDYAGHPFAVELSRFLASKGHEVLHAYAGSLQTPRGDLALRPDDPPGLFINQIEMDPDYTQFKYSFRHRRLMEIAYGKACASVLKDWKPDAVLSANTPTEAQEYILATCNSIGARFILWVQDFYSIAVDKLVRKKIPLIGSVIGAYYKRMERRQLHASDGIVAITEDFVPIMQNRFQICAERITVIPNWAPIASLPVLDKRNTWSRTMGMDDHFVFLYSGTLGMKHNPDMLLQLALQYRQNPTIRLVVISEGIGARWLLDKKEDHQLQNLHILAYQPFSLMPEVLASADVLLTVLDEDAGVFSVPSKVLTYLCARRPQLLAVPAVNLASRLIVASRAGVTVDPTDLEGFLKAAESLRSNPALAQACAMAGRLFAEQTFNIERIAARFGKVLGISTSEQPRSLAVV